jgi:hypothetical protein
VILCDVILDSTTKGLEKSIEPVDLGFKLRIGACATPRLLAFEIDAWSIVPSTPRARRLEAVALDLTYLTCFASDAGLA